jgi:deoxyribodipyrimidine photo-lyase
MNIFWFRRDLRLSDNPGLVKAVRAGIVIPIYIHDESCESLGGASSVWLHHALEDLNASLDNKLNFFMGSAVKVIDTIVSSHSIDGVYWNRCYDPALIKRDTNLKADLKARGIKVESDNASLLWEPWEVSKDDGTPYKVFTPYYKRGCLSRQAPRVPINAPRQAEYRKIKSAKIADLNLLPNHDWHQKVSTSWNMTQKGGKKALKQFIESKVPRYKDGRDQPALDATSKISPYLHFGQLSPNQAWYAAKDSGRSQGVETFLSELGWREFSYYLLYHFPKLPRKNFQTKFDAFPWQQNKKLLRAWQQGMTGYPIIDAGMRELWQTGYMHNRVRMIVASFLVKNCLIDWRQGADWFWDCLFDADLASNSASWQWVAGSGADAAPYFRIFNPVTQAKKFDPDGQYVLRYVPELYGLPAKYLYDPSNAPESALSDAGIKLGRDYPRAMVDLKDSRVRALDAFKKI